MSIDSYRKIMDLLYSKNEFIVDCYDIVHNTTTRNKMYFATEEMPKLWTIARALNGEEWVEVIGVEDYTVEMVGTNSSLEKVDILYYDNNNNFIAEATQSVDKGAEAIVGYNFIPETGYRFDGVWLDENGVEVKNGEAITVITEKKLYAKVVDTNQYTLSFSYGKGIAPINSLDSQIIINIPIRKGQTIASAIAEANIQTTNGTFVFPSNGTGLNDVTYTLGGNTYTKQGQYAFAFDGWYWTNEKNPTTKVDGETVYNYDFNRTIFQHYTPIKNLLTYVTNTPSIELESQLLGYGDTITLPRLAVSGYSFKGWFLDENFTKQAPTTMPPQGLIVYAKWE